MLTGSGFLLWSERAVSANIAAADEEARPAEVELTLLTVSDCPDCFDLGAITKAITGGPFKVLEENAIRYDSDEGRSLVEKYGISTVPTVIIQGEIEKENASGFLKDLTDKKEDAAVWSVIPPVFADAKTGQQFGHVKVTMIDDKSCAECYDPRLLESLIQNNFGVNFSESLSVDRYSVEGARLVSKYGIKALPTLILSPDAAVYRQLVLTWPSVGSIETDGSFVLRDLGGAGYVYRDLATGEVVKPVTNN